MKEETLNNPPSLEARLLKAIDENFELRQKVFSLESKVERYEWGLNMIVNQKELGTGIDVYIPKAESHRKCMTYSEYYKAIAKEAMELE